MVRSPCPLLLQAAYHHVLSAQVVESENMPVDVKKLARHVARTLCFLTALMVVCQADLPFPCSSPGDLGTYFLFPHTHTLSAAAAVAMGTAACTKESS